MPAKSVFEYGYQDVVDLSDWPLNRLQQDAGRGDVDMERLASIVLWLASNGKPWLRAQMFQRLAKDALGINPRRPADNKELELQLGDELLKLIFTKAAGARKKLSKRLGKRPNS